MSGHIFLINDADQLVEMEERAYDSEALLQLLLAQYPNLLAGDQMNSIEPRKWILVSRETSIPDEDYAGGRWSLDHLFLDQEAIPTLVEVKRSTDTRIRREVIGQMLDYAANAIVYWKTDDLRHLFEENCQQQGDDPDEALSRLLDLDTDSDTFWERVRTNLRAGKVRLIFVADQIPQELKRVIEFLNTQMNPAEVLGVEIKQYAGQGQRTLVPTVIGQTAEAQQSKSGRTGKKRKWDEPSFFEAIERESGTVEAQVARQILDWAEDRHLRIWWGEGATMGSFLPVLDYNDLSYQFLSVWTRGSAEVQFQYIVNKFPFDGEAKRLELLDRINAIPGIALPHDSIARRPSFALAALKDQEYLDEFLGILDWFIDEIKQHN